MLRQGANALRKGRVEPRMSLGRCCRAAQLRRACEKQRRDGERPGIGRKGQRSGQDGELGCARGGPGRSRSRGVVSAGLEREAAMVLAADAVLLDVWGRLAGADTVSATEEAMVGDVMARTCGMRLATGGAP